MTWLVVMGVSGCGKSHVGAALATRLGLPLIEGDEYHSDTNRALMRQGIPLTDAHRAVWLARLGDALAAELAGAVLTCSALKAAYRERLRAAAPGLAFVHLTLSREQARARVAQRGSHYFNPALVDSQFDTLQPPAGEPRVLALPATQPLAALNQAVLTWLQAGLPAAPAPQES